jgi:hypothetical protein
MVFFAKYLNGEEGLHLDRTLRIRWMIEFLSMCLVMEQPGMGWFHPSFPG